MKSLKRKLNADRKICCNLIGQLNGTFFVFKELNVLKHDVSRLQNSESRLESQLTSEQGYRNDLENRNRKLEEEVRKVCTCEILCNLLGYGHYDEYLF